WPKSDGSTPFFTPLTWHGATSVDFNGPTRATLQAYNQVRNTVQMQFYPGLMKGAQATLETKEGNDWDQAAAMVSLLPPSLVDTRFYTGQVQLPTDKAMQWVGATTTEAVTAILRAARLADPNTSNPPVTHAWVAAYLPGPNGLDWIPFDPSWKFQEVLPVVANIRNIP